MSIGTLTLNEALAELAKLDLNTITKADLEAIVQQVSVQDPVAGPNATTYLYSRPVIFKDPGIAGDEGLSSNQLANAIADFRL